MVYAMFFHVVGSDLIIGILYKTWIDHEGHFREGEPFVFAVTLSGKFAVSLCSAAEKPPLALSELIEAAQVGTAAVAFIEELKAPLAEHPVHIERIEARARLVYLRSIGSIEIALTHFVDKFLGSIGVSAISMLPMLLR